MATKGAKLRAKRARQRAIQTDTQHDQPALRVVRRDKHTNRPTAERLRHGAWAKATGADRRSQPMVDLASDMIGRLYVEKRLTAQQVESARAFQDIYAPYQAELGLAGFKSCLAGGSGGHDDGDGNPEAFKAFYAMRDRVGATVTACLSIETAKLADEKPRDLDVLRNALNRMGAG